MQQLEPGFKSLAGIQAERGFGKQETLAEDQ